MKASHICKKNKYLGYKKLINTKEQPVFCLSISPKHPANSHQELPPQTLRKQQQKIHPIPKNKVTGYQWSDSPWLKF